MTSTSHDTTEETLLLTLDEVARELRCSRRTVAALVSDETPPARRLKSMHIGRNRRVAREDLVAYIRTLKGEPA